MRILDTKNIEIQNPDLKLGYLKEDRVLFKHHNAVEEIKEEFHYEIEKEYENGGQDLKRIIDKKGQDRVEAWDEYEDVLRYILYDEMELLKKENTEKIQQSKKFLEETDYIVTKIAERKLLGIDVFEDLIAYNDVLVKRENARKIINDAEAVLLSVKKS